MEITNHKKQITMTEILGVRCQVSEGKGSDHQKLYGCGGQRIELRGRRSEVRREGLSCGSGFQPRFDYRAGPLMQDNVSAYSFCVSFSRHLTPDT